MLLSWIVFSNHASVSNQYFHAAADGFSQSFSDDVIILFSTGFRQLYECRQKWSNDLGKSP